MTDGGDFSATVNSARAAADSGDLDEWMQWFLASDGSDNAELAEQLSVQNSHWYGPIEIEFDRLHRLAGPPDQPTLERLTDDDVDRVADMVDSIEDGWTPPPFVVTVDDDHLVLEDGNHRVEGLRRAGRDRYWSIVGFGSVEERDRFVDNEDGEHVETVA